MTRLPTVTRKTLGFALLAAWCSAAPAAAGPYSLGAGDADNPFDAPVPGFVGPHGIGQTRLDDGFGGFENPDNYVNPLFFGWGSSYTNYLRSDGQGGYSDPVLALGEVTGDVLDVVSLGDLNATAISNGDPVGEITILLDAPIRDLSGADFVVFENAAYSEYTTPTGSVEGQVFAELARVEVSADGENFVAFATDSLTTAPVNTYGTIDPTDVFHLAGKHANSYGESWGTPFDLAAVGIDNITHIRLIDVPGSGDFTDSGNEPEDDPDPIYDAWQTFGSGGADIDAIGAISVAMEFADWPQLAQLPAGERGESDDPDGDGLDNLAEYAFVMNPWVPEPGRRPLTVEWVDDGGSPVPELVFQRDERLLDLTYEFQVSGDHSNWVTLARSSGGQPLAAVDGHQPTITETSAGAIASVGVIREVRIRETAAAPSSGGRFHRVKVSLAP